MKLNQISIAISKAVDRDFLGCPLSIKIYIVLIESVANKIYKVKVNPITKL